MAAVTIIKFNSAMLRFSLLILFAMDLAAGHVGVCYGRLGYNLPSPSQVVALYKQNNIKRMRIYTPDPAILQALSGSNIEVMLDVQNNDLSNLAASQANANAWVKNNVKDYPNVRFRYIAVGNEVSPREGVSRFVLFSALQNVYDAVIAAGLGNWIRVSTIIDSSFIPTSFPPSNGEFGSEATDYLQPIIEFLVNTRTPLFANLYPYFTYINNEKQVNLQYALLQPNNGVVMPDGTRYDNLLYAQLDAMYAALEKIGGSSVEIVVTETGWPSAGAGNATTIENARIYNTNLIKVVKNGTPKRPGWLIETYIFGMFDENMKVSSASHFGIFLPNSRPKYPISFGTLTNDMTMTCMFSV